MEQAKEGEEGVDFAEKLKQTEERARIAEREAETRKEKRKELVINTILLTLLT